MTARQEGATRQLTARMPAELHRRVRLAAVADGRSLQEVVKTALVEWLARREEEK